MHRSLLPILLVPCLLLVGSGPGTAAEERRTLTGEYRSNDGDGPVRAIFVPTGARLWQVTFDFTFNGRRRTYRGTAEGSFEEGRLDGRVQNEYGRRTFTFRGEYEDGIFRGRHAELYRGHEVPTGTLTMADDE